MTEMTQAAVCFGPGEDWKVVDVELRDPTAFEVQVRLCYAGLCHTDEHLRLGDLDLPDEAVQELGGTGMYPTVGGHEGSGIVEAVGSGVRTLQPGDHVATSFVPSCGTCHWCATGRQNLCDLGVHVLGGPMIDDRTWRYFHEGQPLNRVSQLGTFARKMVCHEKSLVKIDADVPLRTAALISCGVATGYGSAVNRGGTKPGDVVVIVGCGGVGSGALLGAIAAGARRVVGVDPIAYKREHAMSLGATHTVESMTDAVPLVQDITRGVMADVVVLTPDTLLSDMVGQALALTAKGGAVVCTAMAPITLNQADINLFDLVMSNKAVLGSLFGSASPQSAIPRLVAQEAAGVLNMEGIGTKQYSLEDINIGYEDVLGGRVIRGVLQLT
jgi:NDMA-dependent alcohol dehydrogenase